MRCAARDPLADILINARCQQKRACGLHPESGYSAEIGCPALGIRNLDLKTRICVSHLGAVAQLQGSGHLEQLASAWFSSKKYVYDSLDDAPCYPLSWRDLMAALLAHQVFFKPEVLDALQKDEEAAVPPRRSLSDFQ